MEFRSILYSNNWTSSAFQIQITHKPLVSTILMQALRRHNFVSHYSASRTPPGTQQVFNKFPQIAHTENQRELKRKKIILI